MRTVRGYIVALESLCIPMLADRGRDGGYRLMKGFKLPPMMFSNDEALALGLLAARNLGLAETASAGAGALAKLERVMPEHLRQRMRAIGEVVTLNMKRANAAGDPEILVALGVAAQGPQQRVRLRYRVPNQVQTEREVNPYGLAFWESNWYAVGYCHLRQDRRSFRLDRIETLSVLPASFGRPVGFDALAYLTEALAALPCAMTFSSHSVLEAVSDGVVLHSQVDDLGWMARELARRKRAPPPGLGRARGALLARLAHLASRHGGTATGLAARAGREWTPRGLSASGLRRQRAPQRAASPNKRVSSWPNFSSRSGWVGLITPCSCKTAISLTGPVRLLPTISTWPALTSTILTRGSLSTAGLRCSASEKIASDSTQTPLLTRRQLPLSSVMILRKSLTRGSSAPGSRMKGDV
ncbi:WYL domain-containing protein [Massilia sp. CCM 8695]|uniref:WYL domain-containing protein n=1 Tax=Massilia frigida TaxID=2609281 RepID=A0ABX0NA89_9BURK|nr:WYL domain-containing protein [Massilia frigida]